MKYLSKQMLLIAAAAAVFIQPSAVHGASKSPHARISLVAESRSILAGDSVELGVRFQLDPEWHIYWKNPGDSGQAPKIMWVLPAGFEVSELVWPSPRRIASGPLMNYGYENQALLRTTLKVPSKLPAEVAQAKRVEVSAHVRFLICREDCIPGEAEISLPLHLDGSAQPVSSEVVALFTEARDQVATAGHIRVLDQGSHVAVEMQRPQGLALGTRLAFVPETPLVIANAVPQVFEEDEETVRLLAEKMDPQTRIERLSGLLITETGARKVWSFSSQVVAAQSEEAAPQPPAKSQQAPTTLWLALGLAFLGGVLLNLMPCVFPVLSLKILGFVAHAHDQRKARLHGWAYAGGVLASFWALALVLVIVRAGSSKLGWGFQLQSPTFLALLCALMLLVGLNLLGVFEVGLSFTRLGGSAGKVTGYWGSFNTGILATVVATPCTAPFMGTALGFALTRPAFESLAVFTSLAAGMAFPYVWLSHAPNVLKRLPRPGHWMEVLRQFLAFPILATVIWLLAVFSQLTGPLAVFELLGAMLVVALGAWIYGSFQRSSGRPGLAVLLAGLSVAAGGWFGVRAANTPALPAKATQAADEFWQPWSPARVAELRSQGRAVFVNFTAAWCISCKTNEVLVFSTPEIRAAFANHDVVALKADWTHKDDVIAQELEAHGRAGVPLYLYYPHGDGTPETLPSVLTKGLVLDALGMATP